MLESRVHYGSRIERLAAEWFLRNHRCRLLARNFRWRGGELDLVFEEERPSGRSELVFVEVRARLAGSWLDGVESVDLRKQHRISRTIQAFLVSYRGRAFTARVDILAWDGRSWEHLRNVWLSGCSRKGR